MDDAPSHYAFDEQLYLRENPDVADAVARGDWPSGHTHYAVTGRQKGRPAAPEVDGAWYARAYALVGDELAAGVVGSLAEHYFRIGQYRGYLPNSEWRRLGDPAACRSKFGGLWTDHGNALDVVAGRLDLGMIDEAQAQLLRDWIDDGYVILPNAAPTDILDRAQEDLERAYDGAMPDLRFAVHAASQNTPWIPEAVDNPAKALDLHWLSPATRDLIFTDTVLAFLHMIFERRAMATQTLGFWRGSAQDGHQDSAYVNYSLPMQFVASWIALEDVDVGAGELFYHVGSHKMPEFLYRGKFKGAEEAKRTTPEAELANDYPRHIALIDEQARGLGLAKKTFLAKRGDALIWSADLAHGGGAISKNRTRKSIVAHYCPAEVAPIYFENNPGPQIWDHAGKAKFTSSQYREGKPIF